jgi:5'-3' exonuclease
VSSDKDLSQLVREDGSVVLHDNARGTTLDADGVRGKFGVDPAQIPDYLGLVGDAVDCLPGVPGVGPKGAAAVLGRFGRIDAVPEDPDAWDGVEVRGAPRLAARIAEHRERALFTRELATVVRTVPGVKARLRDLRAGPPDPERVRALCSRLGWEGIEERMLGSG